MSGIRAPRGGSRLQCLTLAGSITGAVIVALDGTVLTIVQPLLQRDLDASFAQVQWTSTGYLIAVASLLVFAGRLGDRYGHQRIFALGILGFGATSAGIGLASGIGWVIALRIAQGVFGALLQPATLGMLRAAYPPDRLGMPIAVRTSAIGAAAAAGPIVGGVLAAHWGWRAVFFLNVLPALAVGVLALVVRVPEPPRERGRGLDLPGAFLLAATLACLVHTLVALPESGWTPTTVVGLLVVIAAGGAFARHELRTANPLLAPGVLRSGPVVPALGMLVSASAAMFGTLFVATYFLQDVLRLDPLQSGLRVLPLAVMMVVGAPVCIVLQRRFGARRVSGAGAGLIGCGILLFAQLDRGASAVGIGGGFLLVGAGFGAVMVTATAVIVRHASVAEAGVAGGLQQTAMNIGPTLGVAAAAMLVARGDFAAMMGPTSVLLAGVALIGVACATRFPGVAPSPAPRPDHQPG
ncbi:MFS transporter [Streptomyces sp. NBC_01304]|uniref:MFS transporter n=1 Tax=Streptomyces sp. NBC_01304 TaxID=2903818 RepID=UPI002E144516|nr:MFS transporter [Streptomyces sp. NBC_01304]